MKIAFFVDSFPALSETFISNQVIGLKRHGHLVHVFSDSRPANSKVHQTVIQSGLVSTTFYLDSLSNVRFNKIVKLFFKAISNVSNSNFPALLKSFFNKASTLSIYNFIFFIDKPKYDIIHAHFGPKGNYVAGLRKLGLFKKAKFITTFHGYDLSKIVAEGNFYSELFTVCNTFTVNSFYSKDRLVKLGCDERKIWILPTGLDTRLFKKTANPESTQIAIRILFVGRLIKLKGPHILIEICHSLFKKKRVNFSATIIGEGAMHHEVSELIEKYHLNEIVVQKGAMTEEEVLDYMNRSEIFILPGIEDGDLAETQGLVIQEAQSMELPVLISNVGGMKEGMLDEVSGFVLPPNDIQGFVEKIELLASDFTLRKKMGEAGRQFVTENYDTEKLTDNLIDLYGRAEIIQSVII